MYVLGDQPSCICQYPILMTSQQLETTQSPTRLKTTHISHPEMKQIKKQMGLRDKSGVLLIKLRVPTKLWSFTIRSCLFLLKLLRKKEPR